MKLKLLAATLLLASCAHKPVSEDKKSVIFIHGSHFDSTVWEKVLPDLQDRYDTYTITLMGRDEVESASLLEMARDACSQVPIPSVLVGHSFGGAVINEMVGICPEKIQQIVYVSALVPLKGERAFDAMGKVDQASYEKAVNFKKDRIVPKEPKTFLLAMDQKIDEKKLPTAPIYSESYAAGADAIQYDDKIFESIPKSYIFTSQDSIVTLEVQKKYTTRTKMKKTTELASGHLPMLSQPHELAEALKKMIN